MDFDTLHVFEVIIEPKLEPDMVTATFGGTTSVWHKTHAVYYY